MSLGALESPFTEIGRGSVEMLDSKRIFEREAS